MVLLLGSCAKVKQVGVTSFELDSVTPRGLRALTLTMSVGVHNPANEITLSEISGEAVVSGKVIGKVTVDPFTMKKRSVEVYHLNARVNLGEGVSLYDMVMLMDDKVLGECVVDVTAKGKLKSGLAKTITKKDIPLKKLLEYAEQKK